MAALRGAVSKNKLRFKEDGYDLDLTYITKNIIAMGFPSHGTEAVYRNPMTEVQRFFSERHPGKHRIYNICSERHYPLDKFESAIHRFRFDDHNPCRLELMDPMCKDIHDWLTQDEENVVAIHCKAGKGRTGLVISMYLVHAGYAIMPNATKIDIPNANAALELFGRQRTSNGKGVTIPSQMRYVHYYERIKAEGGVRPTKRFRLLKVRLITTPNFDVGGGCDPYFHIKMHADDSWSDSGQLVFGDSKTGGKKIFDWSDKSYGGKIKHYKRGEPFIDLDCGAEDLKRQPPLLMGDVKFIFYDHDPIGSDDKMFHFWFNTAYVEKNYLRFQKPVLDRACKDYGHHEFDEKFAVELWLEEDQSTDYKDVGGDDNDIDEHTDPEDDIDPASLAGEDFGGGRASAGAAGTQESKGD